MKESATSRTGAPTLHPHHDRMEQSGRSVCWNCEKTIEDVDICPSCVRVQPFGEERNYFRILDVPEKLALDPRLLIAAYHEKSRLFHPDHHVGDTDKEQGIALANASLVNLAFRTLRDPFLRARYYISRKRGEDGRPKKTSLPPEVLMEVMDLREEVQSLNAQGQRSEAEAHVRRILDPLEQEIYHAFDRVDTLEGEKASLDPEIDRLAERLEKRAYIQNLLAELKETPR